MMLDIKYERDVDFYPGFGSGGTQATAEADGIGRSIWSAKSDDETQEQLEQRLRQQLEAWASFALPLEVWQKQDNHEE